MSDKSEKQPDPSGGFRKIRKVRKHVTPAPENSFVDVNMEASMTADVVIRAGGFGATDGINSFLPVGSDSTDFEAYLHDDRDYEDSQDEIPRVQPTPSKNITEADSVIQAGSFEATNFIGSVLPVASGCHDDNKYKDSEVKAKGKLFPPEDFVESHGPDRKEADELKEQTASGPGDAIGQVNSEASVTQDEVIRAGGFGATDDISNFLPVASDFTDFEAHLRDARDYENLDEQINRPGLGWSNETK